MSPRTSLAELAALFLRLGATAFGGPAAHVAMMRDEVVHRRRWLTDERFLDLLGATNLIPGPNSTEMAIHIGWARRRWAGLVVAGVCFIVPAMLLTGALGWAYVRFGKLPQTDWLLWGVKPVIVAVVLQAIWKLAQAAASSWPLRGLAVVALGAAAFGIDELAVLFGAGALAVAGRQLHRRGAVRLRQLLPVPVITTAATVSSLTLSGLFLVFLKIGSVLFGSGYVLLAFLRADFVERLHWITERQLLDAVAVGQVTPGPVFTTATFIGYVLGGAPGAAVATIGIFLPAFVFVALSGVLLPRIRHAPAARAALDGVNVASLALMAVVTVQLARAAVVDWTTLTLALLAAVALFRWKINSAWLVLAGAAIGIVTSIW